ncbi:DUF3575 domain-containing protein [Algoriphagus sp. NG3]|uniref:DUF3575 domain-containing protein n=1 Tax=unclassified Algoriphagus TaxID=2641541 RepID=UPI002A8167B2|nr:DUF3575 domain-containing protein [Algoriphagus sp. NG3]WPR74158.1 DUF3575 domain-containing protein [Algoriphagus sp. NG3]
MKKVIFTLILLSGIALSGYSQAVVSSSSQRSGDFTNEVKANFLNLIWLGSVELGYERYLSPDHSLDLQVMINDRFGFNNQKNGKTYKTNSIQAAMNFYFGDNANGRIYIYPLAKIRFGDFEEPADNGGVNTTDMNAFILGAGVGYKWEVSNNFAFGPYASIARNFSSEVSDRFSNVELNGGFSLGYRF